MQVKLKESDMQYLNGVIANTKAEAARGGHWAGFKVGFFAATILSVLVAVVLVCDGRLTFERVPGPPPATAPATGPIGVPVGGVVPPLNSTTTAQPAGGLPPPLHLQLAPAPDQN